MEPWLETLWKLPRRVLVLGVKGYRLLLKPWLGNACRFEPTCSAYALQALDRHGAVGGSALTGWRILRCHPWCQGGCDPVPDNFPRPLDGLFTRWVQDRPATEPVPVPEPLEDPVPTPVRPPGPPDNVTVTGKFP